jgi:hypothetical protein
MSEQQQYSETPAESPEPTDSPAAPDRSPAVAWEPQALPSPAEEDEDDEQPARRPRKRLGATRTPARDPAEVASYFIACPRCSFFVASYRLICQDFDEAAAAAADDWLDLTWNLAVRNLLAKSYGYDLADPFEAFQGVCPDCRRAFAIEIGDEEAGDVATAEAASGDAETGEAETGDTETGDAGSGEAEAGDEEGGEVAGEVAGDEQSGSARFSIQINPRN